MLLSTRGGAIGRRLYKCDRLGKTGHIGKLSKRVASGTQNYNLREYWRSLRKEREKQTSKFKEIHYDGSDVEDDVPDVSEDEAPSRPEVPGFSRARQHFSTFRAMRLRWSPFRNDPEWELDDADVATYWQRVDVARLCALGLDFVSEATELITSLGRWPQSTADSGCKPERAEARLAIAVRAWFALCPQELRSSPKANALAKLRSIRRQEAPAHAQEAWCAHVESMLKRLGLHVRGVSSNTVCHYIPSKRRSIDQQKALLKKAGVYHALSFGYETTQFNAEPLFVDRNFMCSRNRGNEEAEMANSVLASDIIRVDTWEKLFVFPPEFVAYNRSGMVRADPQSARWCCEKQCFDYTPYVTREDWVARWLEQQLRKTNAYVLKAGRTFPHPWVSSQYICQREEAEATELRNSIQRICASSSPAWRDALQSDADPEKILAMLEDPTFSVRAPYHAFTQADWERNCQHWNTQPYRDVTDRYATWSSSDWLSRYPPSTFWETWCQVASWTLAPEDCVWVGGTYARHPKFFPPEQSQHTWIYEHLRPLGIQPSEFMRLKLRRGAKGHANGSTAKDMEDAVFKNVFMGQQRKSPLRKYFIPGCVGRGKHRESREFVRRRRLQRLGMYKSGQPRRVSKIRIRMSSY